uniref:NADH-ubiquinone oxidoreductase chain 4 n=1 Tax=Anindobothrium anacolum TaxID=2034264 RepID=A0A8K1SYB5_9CEST|nr:NADH dehydrogenase subunit 4 [Anindobothrium anacolum]
MSVYNIFGSAIFLVISLIACLSLLFSKGVLLGSMMLSLNDWWLFDSLSFYLVCLVVFLGVYSLYSNNSYLSSQTKIYLGLSLFFSGACFCVNHAVLFWCFYELSMLPLLYLIFKDSPYSERFIAGWYFSVYLIVTSLPLILMLLYISEANGSFYFSDWGYNNVHLSILLLLSFVFFTKVPLSPFHTWLPIVHAEATSIVSIFLSGYIMKLGLLGVYRCCSYIFTSGFYGYLFFCCVLSVFFLITASGELDGKRWLAFLSLSHIVIPFLSFFVASWQSVSLSFIFCLGHGLSAGLVFGSLWLFYESTNSRNWVLLKTGVSGVIIMLFFVMAMLSLCSFPPTMQFFSEVNLLKESTLSWVLLVFWSLYLFFGGLVPMAFCGHTLIRNESVETSGYNLSCFVFYFFYLSIWCYLGVFVI